MDIKKFAQTPTRVVLLYESAQEYYRHEILRASAIALSATVCALLNQPVFTGVALTLLVLYLIRFAANRFRKNVILYGDHTSLEGQLELLTVLKSMLSKEDKENSELAARLGNESE